LVKLDKNINIVNKYSRMKIYSSIGAAKELGLSPAVITKYIKTGKIPKPRMTEGAHRYIWTDEEIEHVRQLLPKIANGRKTRYKKQSAKTKAQPKAKSAVPRKKTRKK
jgi:predicted site-specific integrase-resolvase